VPFETDASDRDLGIFGRRGWALFVAREVEDDCGELRARLRMVEELACEIAGRGGGTSTVCDRPGVAVGFACEVIGRRW
jgi:hypothetical protein